MVIIKRQKFTYILIPCDFILKFASKIANNLAKWKFS